MTSPPISSKKHVLDKVIGAIAYLQFAIEGFTVLRLYDQHTISEDFFARILNLVYPPLNLINLNGATLNTPGIDLGDSQAGVCFQVTSENTRTKIKDTIAKYIAHGHHKTYPELRILLIGRRKGKYDNIPGATTVNFDPKTKLIAVKDLQRTIGNITALPRLIQLGDAIDEEMPAFSVLYGNRQHTDVQTLSEYRSYFDRPALQDAWIGEGNYGRFEKALDDLISLLNSGTVDGKPVTKRRSQISNHNWRNSAADLYSKVQCLRLLFTTHVNTGEIDIAANTCRFHDAKMNSVFNDFKEAVVTDLNLLLAHASLPPIRGVTHLSY